jgi:hypothetical protein
MGEREKTMRRSANLTNAPLFLALPVIVAAAPAPNHPQTILFIGNSFTFGALSPVRKYRVDSATDLNGDGIGGVPALFELFTVI